MYTHIVRQEKGMEQNKKNGTAISKDINENMKKFKQIFADCSDIKMRQMYLGEELKVACMISYVETSFRKCRLHRKKRRRMTSRCSFLSATSS